MNGRPLDALLLTTNTFRIADWINLIKSHTKAESYHGTFLQMLSTTKRRRSHTKSSLSIATRMNGGGCVLVFCNSHIEGSIFDLSLFNKK